MSKLSAEAYAIIEGRHTDPFRYLGLHAEGGRNVVRAFLPEARNVEAIGEHGERAPLEQIHESGLFAGPLLPNALVQRRLIPVVPAHPRLVFQAVHSHDVGHAYLRALTREETHGAFNIAAEPVLDPQELGRVLGARPVPIPGSLLRGGAALSYRLRLQPSEPGWVDMGLGVPLMDVSRARDKLSWSPQRSASEALLDLIEGIRDGAGLDTPPLEPGDAGPLRVREFARGVGARTG